MLKNGTYFLSFVDSQHRQPGIWDPYAYRQTSKALRLDSFVEIQRVSSRKEKNYNAPFGPIEYRHIHGLTSPVFTLERTGSEESIRFPMVSEGTLLLGTMRAYLGNVVVTPKAEWLGRAGRLSFSVRSEFVEVRPTDGLVYFWRSFFQSSRFLHSLPTGGGGTRPRLDSAALGSIAVDVPELEVRQRIHSQMMAYAERAWSDYFRAVHLLESHALT